MNKRMFLQTDVSTHDIHMSLIEELSHEELVEFIIDLDSAAQDWGVTKKLYKYFQKEMKKFKEEKGSIKESN